MTWTVPRMWDGETVAVLASGPSMSQSVADQVRGLKTIAVNTTFQLAPWADLLFAGDARWWNHYRGEVAHFEGLKVCVDQPPQIPVPGLLFLKNAGADGFHDDPSGIMTGKNSGYGAIHIAAHAGAKRILLCGFDMHGRHWHGMHPATLRNAGDGVFQTWLPRFVSLKLALDQRGVEVINCTPGSALKVFPAAKLEDVIEACALPVA